MADDLSPEGLDLAPIKARSDAFGMGSVRHGLHELALRAAKSAEDVPTLIEEIGRLRSELARERSRPIDARESLWMAHERTRSLLAETERDEACEEVARYRSIGWAVTVEWRGPGGMERQQHLVRALPDPPWAAQVDAVEVFVRDGDS